MENTIKQSALSVAKPSGEANNGLFFVGIIYTGNKQQFDSTLHSVLRQKISGSKIEVHVFYDASQAIAVDVTVDITLIPYSHKEDFFRKILHSIDISTADYCTVLWSNEELFDNAFYAVHKIFEKYRQVTWLTGIQTFQAKNGFNITLGSTALRRWSYKIYEHNLYKNSGRYIPPASTFWRKSIWPFVSASMHFVTQQDFCEDLWFTFLQTQQLYTCKIYFSTSRNHDKLYAQGLKQPNSYLPIEETIFERIKEYFFINNIPYLRLLYRHQSKLASVIRFDHSTQSYFLSEY